MCWHFYAGETLHIHIIEDDIYSCIKLGDKTDEGELFQHVVPANTWFASEPAPGTAFSLAGCTVAPGFDFLDFEMGKKQDLLNAYPKLTNIITRLCR